MWAARPAPPLPQRGGTGSPGVFPMERGFLRLLGGPGARGKGRREFGPLVERCAGSVPSWSPMGSLVPSWSTVGVWSPHRGLGKFGTLPEPCGVLGPPWSPAGVLSPHGALWEVWDPHGAMWGFCPLMEPSGHWGPSWCHVGVFTPFVVPWKVFGVLHAVREFVSLRAPCEVLGPSWMLAHLVCWCLMLVFQQHKHAERDGAFHAGTGVRIGSGPEALWVQSCYGR